MTTAYKINITTEDGELLDTINIGDGTDKADEWITQDLINHPQMASFLGKDIVDIIVDHYNKK